MHAHTNTRQPKSICVLPENYILFQICFFQINIHIAIGYWSDTSYSFFLNSNILYCIRMFFVI
jgi:hypothetical protein